MCRKALRGILKVSERHMKTVEMLYSEGISTIATIMSYGRKISQKRTIAYGWFSKVDETTCLTIDLFTFHILCQNR